MREIVVDIDGILTLETEGFGPKHYPKRTPNKYNIDTLKDYKRRGFKVKLFSARYEEDRVMTKQWLLNHNVPFDELTLAKPQGHQYIDDRATNELDREVLLFSGGVDSLIAWHYLEFPQPLYVLAAHRYLSKEVNCIENLSKIIPKLNVEFAHGPSLGKFEFGDKAYIAQRNFHFALMASHYGNKIYMGGIKGDKVEDKTPEAFKVISFAMNFVKKPSEPTIKIKSPFWEMTKTDIIKWFLDNYPRAYVEKVLKTSISCYDQKTYGSCGRCSACFRKWIALESVGLKTWKWFEKDIRKWKGCKEYREKMEKGEYDMQRTKETLEVLDKYNI